MEATSSIDDLKEVNRLNVAISDLRQANRCDRVMLKHLETLARRSVNRLDRERLSWALCLVRIRGAIAMRATSCPL